MKFFVSNMFDKSNVFFTSADSFTLITQKITEEVLLRELKLACLIYDHVIFAAAYFWQSRQMYCLMPHIEVFMENGSILPAIRDYRLTRDANDYLDKRLEESTAFVTQQSPVFKIPALAAEIAKPTQRPIANDLNRIGTFIHLDVSSIDTEFRRLWMDDLCNLMSPGSLRDIIAKNFPNKNQDLLINSLKVISKGQYFSRSLIANHILNLSISNNIKYYLIQRASELYLLSNAICVNGELLCNSRSVKFISDFYGKSFGQLSRANVDIFVKFLEICNLPLNCIDRMSCHDILVLKHSREFIAFKKLYLRIMEEAINEKNIIVDELVKRFSLQKKIEYEKRGLVRILNLLELVSSGTFVNTLSSILISGFSPALPLITIGSGATAALSYFLKKMQVIQETPILNFIDFIKEGKFRNKLYRNILKTGIDHIWIY